MRNPNNFLLTDHCVESRHGRTRRKMCRKVLRACWKSRSAPKPDTPCMDDHSSSTEDFNSTGDLAPTCAHVVLTCLYFHIHFWPRWRDQLPSATKLVTKVGTRNKRNIAVNIVIFQAWIVSGRFVRMTIARFLINFWGSIVRMWIIGCTRKQPAVSHSSAESENCLWTPVRQWKFLASSANVGLCFRNISAFRC